MTTQEKFFEAIRRLDSKKVVELLNLSERMESVPKKHTSI